MENIEIIFRGTSRSQTQNKRLKCFSDFESEEIVIILGSEKTADQISLNRITAIRLAKELKKQIGNLPY